MTRNHFSRHGGPYFINDGLSSHNEEDIKPDKGLLLSIAIGGSIMLITLYALVIAL
jgi:hypothetical protein